MNERANLLHAEKTFINLFTPMWFWVLDPQFNVLESDCPRESIVRSLFLEKSRKAAVQAHMAESDLPMCISVESRLSWVMVFEKDGDEINRIHVMGPFFIGANDPELYRDYLTSMKLSEGDESDLLRLFETLPALMTGNVSQMAVTIHYCVRLEKINPRDITFYMSEVTKHRTRKKVDADQFDKSSGRWETEEELLAKIREGDVTAGKVLDSVSHTYAINAFQNKKSADRARQNIHQLLTLISRAAVEGGLPQRTSFSLCTYYRNRIESIYSGTELQLLSQEMIRDYAGRVQSMKKYAKCSPQIKLCCEYIDTHSSEKLTLEKMAEKAGYSPFHLSRKFQEEMGCSIIDYIQKSKLTQAKYLLEHTNVSMDEISEELGFNSRTYFTSVFKKHVGMTPSAYRKKFAKL